MSNHSNLIEAAEILAQKHHLQYDSSHDFLHVDRVRKQSLLISRSLPASTVDLLVIELAALFHDLIDSKYLPQGIKISATERLSDFWKEWSQVDIDDERRRLVERIVENVSYSKEIKRIKNGEQTEWHTSCLELHAVQDADKLDAIGAFGILRCAAYSGAASVPLFTPPSSNISTIIPLISSKSSAIDHFTEKLINLEGMMKTEKGKFLAIQRTKFLKTFMKQIDQEWSEIDG